MSLMVSHPILYTKLSDTMITCIVGNMNREIVSDFKDIIKEFLYVI